MKNTKIKSAGSLESGNKQKTVTAAWLDFVQNAESKRALDALADALDRLLRERLPGKALDGLLNGREPEIRQESNLLLLDRYLLGNRKLLDATATATEAEVLSQIERSVSAVIRISKVRLRRSLAKEAGRWASIDDVEAASEQIPVAEELGYWALPYDQKQKLALLLLRTGVKEAALHKSSAEIATAMLDEGVTQAEMARRLKVSRSAIHQRLAPVRKYLRAAIQNEEASL